MKIVKINLPIGKSKSWKMGLKAAYAHPWPAAVSSNHPPKIVILHGLYSG